MTPGEKRDWLRAPTEHQRRTLEGRARELRRQEHEDRTNGAARCEREDREIEAQAAVAAAPIPSLDSLRAELISNPDALGALLARCEAECLAVRRLPDAPHAMLDHRRECFRRSLSALESHAHRMLAAHRELQFLAETSARRREFTTWGFLAATPTAVPQPRFDAANFVARLATRGVILTLGTGPDGPKIYAMHGMLNPADRETIDRHRPEIIGVMSQLEEV
jgi:hypothetical protein